MYGIKSTTVISCAGGPSEGDAIVTCSYTTTGVRAVAPALALMRGCVVWGRMQHAGTAARQANRPRAGGTAAQRQHGGDASGMVATHGGPWRGGVEPPRLEPACAGLGDAGGRQVDGDALGRQGEAQRPERRAHPLARFGHRLVGQADHGEGRQTGADMNMNIDLAGLDTVKRNRIDVCNQTADPPVKRDGGV